MSVGQFSSPTTIAIGNQDREQWVLIEALMQGAGHDGVACLHVGSITPGFAAFDIFLPVLPNGRVHELVRLPKGRGDVSFGPIADSRATVVAFEIRCVSYFERTWRMANRVFDCFTRLPRRQRLELGLGMGTSIFSLREAYRRATSLRFLVGYKLWRTNIDKPDDIDRKEVLDFISAHSPLPHFFVLVISSGDANALERTMASLKGQINRAFSGTVVSNSDVPVSTNLAGFSTIAVSDSGCREFLSRLSAEMSSFRKDQWLMLLREGDVLPPHALAWLGFEALSKPDAFVFYFDDDMIGADGTHFVPRFKPDWSLTHFRSTDFIGNALVIKGGAVAAAGGLDYLSLRFGQFDLLLRAIDSPVVESGKKVAHIPAILLHRSLSAGLNDDEAEAQVQAINRHLVRNAVPATVVATSSNQIRHIRLALPLQPPLVSIIIPTRDSLDFLRQCVESILEKTNYPNFEILIVDNQSSDMAALAYLDSLDGRKLGNAIIRVIRYQKAFNYSAINNFAVAVAQAELICLLNNDTEVISPDWLEEMVGHLLQPDVGAVGAKLYYPDGRVQHAGDVVGAGGCANHLHSMIPHDAPGYCNRAIVAQELSAVTAACLLTRKTIFYEVGGLDARFLRVAFNDVDYCLKLRKAGYKVVWTPHAELYHHESVSRGRDCGWQKTLRAEFEVFTMRRRWRKEMQDDPFYNPNLSYVRPDFSMSHVRRVRRPWEAGSTKEKAKKQ